MEKLNLKHTHKPIRDYYEVQEQYYQHDLTHEGTVSNRSPSYLTSVQKK